MAKGGTDKPELPEAIEAEQAVLGLLLYENSTYAMLPAGLTAGHFIEPFHRRLFQRIKMALDGGGGVDAVLLSASFDHDPAFHELGGVRYLADLIDRAPPAQHMNDYGRVVIDVAVRRALVKTGQELLEWGGSAEIETDQVLADLEKTIGELHLSGETLQLVDADEAMARVLDQVDNPGKHGTGILTGLQSLDDTLGPWLPDDLIALAGRPGMGKSAIAAIISQNVALAGGGVIEIHGEMSIEQVWRRRMTATAFGLFAGEAPAYSSIRKRTITYDQRQMLDRAREHLQGIHLKAIKRTGLTIGRMRSLVLHQRALWERMGVPLSLLVIDHGGLLEADREYSSRVEQQSAISKGLKQLADQLKIPILVLLQLNRKVEDRDNKRPMLPDLRDSGSWEQDADVVIGAYRDAYYAQREKEPDLHAKQGVPYAEWDGRRRSPWIEALLLKVREGETGMAKLWANMRTNTILGAEPPSDLGGFI